MFVRVEENLECSRCGSRDYETFRHANVVGTRCRRCGHEETKRDPATEQDSGGASWSKSADDVTTF